MNDHQLSDNGQKNSEMLLSDLPESLLERVSSILYAHSTGLFRISVGEKGIKEDLHVGAGTFVSHKGEAAILTAAHVAEKLTPDSALGLVVGMEGEAHRVEVPMEAVNIRTLGNRESDEFGPDASLISLNDWEDVETIRTAKSFFNLSGIKDEILSNPPRKNFGIWAACGTPEEEVKEKNAQEGFGKVIAVEKYCGFGGPDRYFSRVGFDYYDYPVGRDGEKNVPQSFKGMSGGGLWQIPLEKTRDGQFVPKRYILSGVAFYEGFRLDKSRFLRCHGRETIYRHLLSDLAKDE